MMPHSLIAGLAASTNNATADIATGGGLLLGGSLLVAIGVAWGLDYRQMTSNNYESVVRQWERIPGIGPTYKKIVPFGQYRYLFMIVLIVMGLLLCTAGIGSLIVA